MSHSDRSPWALILLIWAAGLGAAAQYGKISVVYDRLPGLYPDAGAALGAIVSLVGAVGIALGIVAGLLVARVGYRRALLAALLVGAAMSLWQGLLPGFGWFLLSRLIEGAAHLAIVVAAPTLIAQVTLERDRGLALSLWSSFFGVAFAVLVWAGLPLVNGFGVPALFFAHAVFMAACALVLALRLPTFVTGDRPPLPGLGEVVRRHVVIYRSPWLSAAGFGWLFYTICFLSLLTLLPPLIPVDWRAPVIGAMPLISIAVSMTLGVALLRRFGAVRVSVLGFALSALAAAAMILRPGDPVLCLALAAALGLVQGAGFALVPELNASMEDRALANGSLAQMGNLGNTLGTPVFAFLLLSAGPGAMLAAVAIVLATGAAVHLLLARRRRIAQ